MSWYSWQPREAWSRALVKTLCYRVLMVCITILVAFFVTGNTAEALSIGVAANVIKTGTYFGYERLWARITWGTTAERTATVSQGSPESD